MPKSFLPARIIMKAKTSDQGNCCGSESGDQNLLYGVGAYDDAFPGRAEFYVLQRGRNGLGNFIGSDDLHCTGVLPFTLLMKGNLIFVNVSAEDKET